MDAERGQWSSKLGFIFAAAGSAIGLGNIWKFPYITGENGGGVFVLIYLVCILAVGIPIMVAELLLGQGSKQSPVGAFEHFHKKGSPWGLVGWLGVATGFVILSYYSVVAGWAMHYVKLSLQGFTNLDTETIGNTFGELYGSATQNIFWHTVFMFVTIMVVIGGVRKGIEKTCNVLMPVLFLLLLFLVGRAVFLPNDGFMKAVDFIFMPHFEKLTSSSILEALGHAFFTLSLGMGTMLTYGSYLKSRKEVLKSTIAVSLLDTIIALLACLMIFPIIFAFGYEAQAGPGLVFKTIPLVFSQIAGGQILSLFFFLLLTLAALSSAISLLEVVTATFIDRLDWRRSKAALFSGIVIFIFGIPSALSGSGRIFGAWADFFGKNFFDSMDYLASNWMLVIGGLLTAIYVGWVMPKETLEHLFGAEFYPAWIFKVFYLLIRFFTPVLVLIVLLNKIGFI